jgi:hypothetical protein
MKTIDPPSSFSATPATASEDPSLTSMLPALDPNSIATLSDTETLRVLEVRRPTREVEEPVEERDSYGVRVEDFQQVQRPALSLVPSKPRILPPPGAAPLAAAPPPAATKPAIPTRPAAPIAQPAAPSAPPPKQSAARALTAELDRLTRKEYVPELADLSSTTGVRHLRIEVKRRAPAKPSAGRKR